MAYELQFAGNTLPKDITQQLVNYATNDLNVPPSYLITKLHYEGLWGGSSVARENNNWGGMTWGDWTSPHKRDSGVTVTRGTPRPANEGGYYIRYASVQDFLIDWSYLIRRGGIYNVADSATFNEAVKGMFIYGGAEADYATMNVEGSKLRYELYLEGMLARRTAINNANDQKLDTLDRDKPTNPVEPEPDEPEPPKINISKIKELLTKDLYRNGNSSYYQNGYLIIQKQLDNTYKVKLTKKLIAELERGDTGGGDTGGGDNDGGIPSTCTPISPVKKGTPITDSFGWRINPVTGESELHNGTDLGGSNNDPIYAILDGKVVNVGYTEWRGNWLMIKHDCDGKYSKYLHMNKYNYAIGDTVKQGDIIGLMGTTGQSTGVHLHITITTTPEGTLDGGEYIDAETYIKF